MSESDAADRMRGSCSAQSLASGEPLIGSAATAPDLIAFSWPKPLWHHDKAALSQGLPARIAELEAQSKRAGRKLALRVFQRASGPPTARVELICARPARGLSLHEHEVPIERLAGRIEAWLSGEATGPAVADRQILICTDGRHDRCCAAHGRSLFDALAHQVDTRVADVSLAECSHLGGHRMAATCLVLPSGRMYGRLRPEHATELFEAIRHEHVFQPAYRGRHGLSELEQLAEAEAMKRWPEAISVSFTPTDDDGIEATIVLKEGSRTLRLRCERREFSFAASCAEPEVETRLRWVRLG